jgi:glutathione S-transferase
VLSEYRSIKAKNDFINALQVLQHRLIETKTETRNTADETNDNNQGNDDGNLEEWYLLGPYLTLADIVIVSTLIYPFQMAFNRDYFIQQQQQQQQCSLQEVVEWFERCVQQPEFQAVLGWVEIGSKLATASSSVDLSSLSS